MAEGRDAATVPGDAAWDAASPVALGATMGRYELRAVLGAGGMGVVFEALDPELARPVAVKVLRSLDDGDGAARMKREGQTMAQLAHPNVIRVYDVGVAHCHAFVAMELVRGSTLSDWLAAAPRTPAEILATFAHAGRGLAAAHAAGLVHRDFKPGNVLVGDDGRVLVTDFGLARSFDDAGGPTPRGGGTAGAHAAAAAAAAVTATGEFVGTPAYMAPEQYGIAPVDARADQFSFCVALWRALFGTAPYAGTTIAELAAAAEADRVVPPPADAAARVAPAVRDALVRGLRGDPAARFATMTELLAALEPTPRRARWPIAIAALVVIAIAGAVIATWAIVSSRSTAPGSTQQLPPTGPERPDVNAAAPPAPDAAPGVGTGDTVAIAPPGLAIGGAGAGKATAAYDAAPAATTPHPDARPRGPRPDADPDHYVWDTVPPPEDIGDYDVTGPILAGIQRKARACGAWTDADGYEARFAVGWEGAPTTATVTGPDPTIAACMKKAVLRARFRHSVNGGDVSMAFQRQ